MSPIDYYLYHSGRGFWAESSKAKTLFSFLSIDIFQDASGWLNDLAIKNIPRIFFTLDTFQSFKNWLNDSLPKNIALISVTLDTSQLFSGWLKIVGVS